MNSYWVDIHTHRPLDGRPGIRSLRIGTDFPDSTDGKISAGIHPWDAERAQREWLDGIRELQPAAVGEVGLDYATDIDREAQRTWLARQRDLAAELGLPLIVHCVRAYDDLKAMLSGFPLPVIVHGFTGSEQLASQLLDRGWYLSFGKTVERSPKTRRTLRSIPEPVRPMKEWMQRTELLLGSDRIERLRNARVLVVGLGGVGAYAAEAIARAGVGTMTIADADAVSESNINRQLPALHSTVGEPKAEAMARRLLDINPGLRLTVVRRYIRDEETETLLDEGFDYVVDAIDTLSPKAGLIRSCLERDIPVVSSMGAGAKTDPTRVRIEDIARSHHCPLAHMLRKRLHKMGIRTGFYVVFSDEPVREGSMMLCEETNKKSNVGTISYMPAVFGCHCASVVIRGLIGEMPPAAFAAETRDNVRHG